MRRGSFAQQPILEPCCLPFNPAGLIAPDVDLHRALCLDGHSRHPEAFGAAFEDEAKQPLDWFVNRLTIATVIGGFDAAGGLVRYAPDGSAGGGSRVVGEDMGISVCLHGENSRNVSSLSLTWAFYRKTVSTDQIPSIGCRHERPDTTDP